MDQESIVPSQQHGFKNLITKGFVDEIIYSPCGIAVKGWAICADFDIHTIEIRLDNIPVRADIEMRISRPDVAEAIGNPSSNNFGWAAKLDEQYIKPGIYKLTAHARTSSGLFFDLLNSPNAEILVVTTNSKPFFQIGSVDHVLYDEEQGIAYLRGWACSSETDISNIIISIDGVEIDAVIKLNLFRPDVADAYGWANWKNTGWRAEFNLPLLSPGSHAIMAQAIGSNGSRWELRNHERIQFEIKSDHGLPQVRINRGWVEKIWRDPSTGFIEVAGWACSSDTRIAEIKILIDGQTTDAQITFGFERQDIAFSFNKPEWKICGWRATLSSLSPSDYSRPLTAQAIGEDGQQWTLQNFRAARFIPALIDPLENAETSRKIAQSIYQSLLFRTPSQDELENVSHKLIADRSLNRVLRDIFTSEEIHKTGILHTQEQPLSLWQPAAESEKLIFLHIPKTGGVTLHNLLAEYFSPKEICITKNDDISGYPLSVFSRYQFYSGHFNMKTARMIPGKKIIVTVLRDPASRLVSLYYYLRAHRPEFTDPLNKDVFSLASRLSISEFFQSPIIRNKIWRMNNDLVRALTGDYETPDAISLFPAAADELENMAAFGITERLPESVELIFTAIGKPIPTTVTHQNRLEDVMGNEPMLRRVAKEPITSEIKNFMADLVEADNLLYQRAIQIFDQRIRRFRQQKQTIE